MSSGDKRSKVLLMGKSGSGKTSMRSIIFANYLARETSRLNPTLDVQHSSVRFLGSLVLNLWDCGGQAKFYENYFTSQRDHIFKDVAVLIYVFDVKSTEFESDLRYYEETISALSTGSPDAHVFVLVHKMDLIPEVDRERQLALRVAAIQARSPTFVITAFGTSIWDETLYKAWSTIVAHLVPHLSDLETSLTRFADVLGADEVVLFERATFLVISHATRRTHADVHRFEKISNIVKQFKLSCTKLQAQLAGMRTGNSTFSAFIDAFTSNTYILVVMSDPSATDEATMLNIVTARPHFEALISTI